MSAQILDLLAGRVERLGVGEEPRALLPGSFNPLHAGHLALAEAASRYLGMSVAFEMTVANADKPALDAEEVARRAAQFTGKGELWLTRAATFVQKARLFPGAVFVVGADTAERIVQARFYGEGGVEAALTEIARHGCRFLVAGRLGAEGFAGLEQIAIPSGWKELFDALEEFRHDISSTQLRDRAATGQS